MDELRSLRHTKSDFKYHVVFCHEVFTPNRWRTTLRVEIRRHVKQGSPPNPSAATDINRERG